MKKLISAVAVIVTAVMVLSLSVFAADNYVLGFSNCAECETTIVSNSTEISGAAQLDLKLTGEAGPHFWFMLGNANKFADKIVTYNKDTVKADEYRFMKIKYRSECTDNALGLYYVTYEDAAKHPGPAFSADFMTDLTITADSEWHSDVFDLGTICGDKWKNYIGALRFDIDPTTGATAESAGKTFSVEYIAFFRTQADADAYGKTEIKPDNPGTSDFAVAAAMVAVSAAAAVVLGKRTGK